MGEPSRLGTGIAGLDHILGGGLLPRRMYLLEGLPGSGKTTIGLQFLRDGVAKGEKVLYVTLAETHEELEGAAASHGWALDGIDVFEFGGSPVAGGAGDYTMFHPSEVELSQRIDEVFRVFERLAPQRVIVDSLSELRLLARDALRFRRQILSLKQFFSGRDTTVIVLDDQTTDLGERQMHSLANGVISLAVDGVEYGPDRRRVKVSKLRGSTFSGGYHDMEIRRGGVQVFPRLAGASSLDSAVPVCVPTGDEALDSLLGGGLYRGTSTLLIGAAGTGKTTLAAAMACGIASRGGQATFYTFDESAQILKARSEALGLKVGSLEKGCALSVEQMDPAEVSPGEFAQRVGTRVDEGRTSMVVIDSLNGYLHAMPGSQRILLQLHELLSHLARRGVVTVMIEGQHGLVGTMQSPLEVSYLADAVILHRFFEARGEIRRAISVIKHRLAAHENTIRELKLDRGVAIGPVLSEFEGVITGTPRWVGAPQGPA
jgi:circadian clock protein KaiC